VSQQITVVAHALTALQQCGIKTDSIYWRNWRWCSVWYVCLRLSRMFTMNMRALGTSEQVCVKFLLKQAKQANLSEGDWQCRNYERTLGLSSLYEPW